MPSANMDSNDDHAYSRSRRLGSAPTPATPAITSSKDANPATELLQDMIREKRAKTQRTKKTYDPLARVAGGDTSPLDHRDVQSSPLNSASARARPSVGSRRASGANGKPVVQKEMGLREMSEHISKVDKQNFDLKLEVFHRRQRNDVLEARVEELEAQEADYEDLHAKYEALLLESDRQKLILDDAVAQICELQSENEELQATIGAHFAGVPGLEPVTTKSTHSPYTNDHSMVPGTPPQTTVRPAGPPVTDRQSSVRSLRSTTSRRMLQTPPSTREDRKTVALHSLYSSDESLNQANPSLISVNRPGSVFSGDDEDDALDRQMLNSPRLSILSESGFSSIYGNPKDSIQASSSPAADTKAEHKSEPRSESSPSQHSAQRDARIDLWIQEKPKLSTPARRSARNGTNDRYTSIEQVLQDTPREPSQQPVQPVQPGQSEVPIPQRHSSSQVKANDSQRRCEMRSPTKITNHQGRSYSSSNGSLTFGGKLPPTPDTMSTATIGGPNSSTQSIITEKSLLDYSRPPSNGYANLVAYGRPQTSGSDFPHSPQNMPNDLNGLGFEDDLSLERSYEDDDVQSTVVAQGDRDSSAGSPFKGELVHPDHLGNSGRSRPPLNSCQTDMMFNGEGFALVQPTRTISYPSPRRSSKHSSAQLSPISQRSDRSQKSAGMSEKTAQPLPPKNLYVSTKANTTPTKTRSRDDKSFSPTRTLDQGSQLSTIVNQQKYESAEIPRPKTGRFQFFRRSNSQNVGIVLESNTASPQRLRTFRSTSSTRTQPRLPGPGNFYGARPGTSDGSTPILARPTQSTNTRRHSAILDHATSFLPRASSDTRRVSEAQQTFRTDEGRSRWPLGRSASAKIKEGLGIRLSRGG